MISQLLGIYCTTTMYKFLLVNYDFTKNKVDNRLEQHQKIICGNTCNSCFLSQTPPHSTISLS